MVSAVSTTITILSAAILSSIIVDAQNQPFLNISFGNQSNSECQISDIDIDITSKVNLCLGNRHYECYWSGKGNNNNYNNSNYTNEDNNMVINYNNLLSMMNCYHVDNNCQRHQGVLMFDCVEPDVNVTNNLKSNGTCILSQSSSDNNGTVNLQCKVIIDTRVRKAYIAAFIAVIVLLVFFFCVCPLCCFYYYCRYTNATRPSFYPNNNAANYETQQFGGDNSPNKNMKSKSGSRLGWMQTTNTEKTTMKVKNDDKIQDIETQPMYNNTYNQTDCDNDRRVQHEIVV